MRWSSTSSLPANFRVSRSSSGFVPGLAYTVLARCSINGVCSAVRTTGCEVSDSRTARHLGPDRYDVTTSVVSESISTTAAPGTGRPVLAINLA
jgi:hypothetical protein